MEVVTLLTADYANITQDGRVNVMGIFTHIKASSFPAKHPEMVLVLKLEASPAEYGTQRKLSVKLLNQDAQETVVDWSRDLTVPSSQTGERVEINQFLRLRNLVFLDEGPYTFYVKVDNDEKGNAKIILEKL